MQILEHLADNVFTYQEIADKFDRAYQTIKDFAHDHRAEIEALTRDHADAMTGFWITRKELRIADAEADYELTDGWLSDLEEAINDRAAADEEKKGEDRKRESRSVSMEDAVKIVKQRQMLRREAAEEMGHLLTRMPNTGPPPAAVKIVLEKE